MPNGYTQGVYDGTVTNPADYIQSVAKGFTWFLHQRDDDPNKPPEKITPRTYHKDHYHDAVAKKQRFDKHTNEQLRAEYKKYVADVVSVNARITAEAKIAAARYDAMIAQVEAWDVDSDPELFKVKEYALHNLRESRKFDVSDTKIEARDFDNWLEYTKGKLQRDIEYYREQWHRETERVNQQNAFTQRFYDSLAVFRDK